MSPDGNKYSIPYLVKKYNLQFDEYGNLKGVNIPEYNRINGTEDDTVKYAKQRAQIQYYAKNVYGNNSGKEELSNKLSSTGSLSTTVESVSSSQESYNTNKTYDFSDVSGVAPDGNKYSIPYLVKKYNLQFDEYGNLKGVDIPEYNRINGTEDDTVKYAKQRAQIQYYAKDVYGKGKWGKGKWGRGGVELDSKYLNENIPSYNKIDLKNDSMTVINAKKKAIDAWYASQNNNPLHDAQLEKAKDEASGGNNIKLSSNDDRATLRKKTFFNKMMNEIPSNKIDYNNDSNNFSSLHDKIVSSVSGSNVQPTTDPSVVSKSKTLPGSTTSNVVPNYNNTPTSFSSLHDKIVAAMSRRNANSASKYGTGKFGRGLLSYINDKILGTAKDFVFGKRQKPLSEKISPSETPKTGTAVNGEETPLAPNGMPFDQNDIDYLVNNGYSKEDALKLLATDKKYTTKVENEAAIKEAEEKEKAKREKEEYEAKQPGMAKMFGWNSHKKLANYYEEKDKAAAKAVSNVEKLKMEQAKAEELKAQQEQQAQKATEIKTKEAEAKAEQANVAASSTSGGESYQEKIISLLTAAVQYLSVIAGNGGGANPSAIAQQQNMTKMKSDLKDIINGTSNIGGISDLVGGSDMSSIMKTLNLVATR